VKTAIPLLLWGFVAPQVSYADTETITLTCDLEVTTQPPFGAPRHSSETAVVELLFDAATGFKAIRIYSAAIPVAVANKKGGAVTSFVDNSDNNRWSLSNRRDRSKVASDESATIDRNTGRITASSVITVGDASQHVEARGTCAQVSSSNRRA
jgi:predicted RNA methylase